ncbi:MAG: hypothetical protein ACSLEZ_00060, partial [Thiobacillus sp.]
FFRMAALLVVAIEPAMSPPRASCAQAGRPSGMPCEKIHPFYPVPLFMIHDTSRASGTRLMPKTQSRDWAKKRSSEKFFQIHATVKRGDLSANTRFLFRHGTARHATK